MASEDGSVVSGVGPSGGGDGFLRKGSRDGSAVITGAPEVTSGVTYRMRAYDTDLSKQVFWNATSIDDTGAQYSGNSGALTNIVVQNVIGV